MFKADSYITDEKLRQWNHEFGLGLNEVTIPSGKLFLREGQRCDYFYYVVKGFVRVFYSDLEGNEVTHWFSPEDSMITSPRSF